MLLSRADCRPLPFGPAYDLIAPERLRVKAGPLSGRDLSFTRDVCARKADFALHETGTGTSSEPMAHCHYDRDPDSGLEIMYDIFVRSEQRNKGLASLLVRLSLRELFSKGRRHWPRIRRLMVVEASNDTSHSHGGTVDPGGVHWGVRPDSTLHNIGIGIVALRLGLRPDPAVARLFEPGTVRSVQLATLTPETPPGLLIHLNSLPGTVIAAFIDSATGRPVAGADVYERFLNPGGLYRQADAGQALFPSPDIEI